MPGFGPNFYNQLTSRSNALVSRFDWQQIVQLNITDLELLRLSDAAVRMDVGDVDGRVPFVGANPAPDPHAQALPHRLLDCNSALAQLRPLDPECLP